MKFVLIKLMRTHLILNVWIVILFAWSVIVPQIIAHNVIQIQHIHTYMWSIMMELAGLHAPLACIQILELILFSVSIVFRLVLLVQLRLIVYLALKGSTFMKINVLIHAPAAQRSPTM